MDIRIDSLNDRVRSEMTRKNRHVRGQLHTHNKMLPRSRQIVNKHNSWMANYKSVKWEFCFSKHSSTSARLIQKSTSASLLQKNAFAYSDKDPLPCEVANASYENCVEISFSRIKYAVKRLKHLQDLMASYNFWTWQQFKFTMHYLARSKMSFRFSITDFSQQVFFESRTCSFNSVLDDSSFSEAANNIKNFMQCMPFLKETRFTSFSYYRLRKIARLVLPITHETLESNFFSNLETIETLESLSLRVNTMKDLGEFCRKFGTIFSKLKMLKRLYFDLYLTQDFEVNWEHLFQSFQKQNEGKRPADEFKLTFSIQNIDESCKLLTWKLPKKLQKASKDGLSLAIFGYVDSDIERSSHFYEFKSEEGELAFNHSSLTTRKYSQVHDDILRNYGSEIRELKLYLVYEEYFPIEKIMGLGSLRTLEIHYSLPDGHYLYNSEPNTLVKIEDITRAIASQAKLEMLKLVFETLKFTNIQQLLEDILNLPQSLHVVADFKFRIANLTDLSEIGHYLHSLISRKAYQIANLRYYFHPFPHGLEDIHEKIKALMEPVQRIFGFDGNLESPSNQNFKHYLNEKVKESGYITFQATRYGNLSLLSTD